LIRISALGGGVSDPRNSALFLMFSLIGIGERAGSGLMNIKATWKEEKLPEPTLKEMFNPDRTTLTLPLRKSNVSVSIGTDINVYQKKVLEQLRGGPMSLNELMEGVQYPFSRQEFMKSILSPLKETGRISLTLPDKPRSKYQKYSATTE